MTHDETSTLLRDCRHGDSAAQRRLYERYSPRLYGLCLRYAGSEAEAQDWLQEGMILVFRLYCAPCHARDMVTPLTGPALAGVTQRRSMAWLIAFTRNSQAMIQAGDSTAVAVWNAWQPVVMPPYSNLTEEEIRSIYAYVEELTQKN